MPRSVMDILEERPVDRVLRTALEKRRAENVQRPVFHGTQPVPVDVSNLQARIGNRRSTILGHGKWLPKLPEPKPLEFNFNRPDLTGFSGAPVAGGGGGDAFSRLFNAIRAKESSGNYGAVNRSSGALGAYQIMPGNLPSWSRAALGRSISRSEFLRSPQLQDAIARHQMLQYYNKYGARGAAIAWYAGPGALRYSSSALNRTQRGGYPSINSYAADILRRAGL